MHFLNMILSNPSQTACLKTEVQDVRCGVFAATLGVGGLQQDLPDVPHVGAGRLGLCRRGWKCCGLVPPDPLPLHSNFPQNS